MNFVRLLAYVLLPILFSLTCLNLIAEAQDDWTGTVTDESLRRLAPTVGFIDEAATWKTVWTAWRPTDDVPQVNFDDVLIIVGTVSGPNRVIMNPQANEQGEVNFVVGGTRIAGPGFGFKFVKLLRQGVKSVNGNPVEHTQRGVLDSVSVIVVGTLRTGIVAIGGETTGTTITANNIIWELDFGDNAALRATAQALSGKKAAIRGRLERRDGVEVQTRWIVSVSDIDSAGDLGSNEVRTPILHVACQRTDTNLQIAHAQDATIIDIRCPFGIDTATINRASAEWPAKILVRLHLHGLESLQVKQDDLTIQWSVRSTGNNSTHVSLRQGRDETTLSEESPYFAPLRIVGGGGKIPLKEGYFEVRLPKKLFEHNPDEIRVRWIDFYRN
jgi:hypothetical protein